MFLGHLVGVWSQHQRAHELAATGRLEEAEAERESLRAIAATEELQALDVVFFYAGRQLEIADRVLSAVMADQRAETEERIRLLREAVKIQDDLPYMEPPYWYYPVRQSLGEALLDAGRYAKAEAVFRRDLAEFPNNGWSLYGLAASLRARGQDHAADEAKAWFEHAWSRADVRPENLGFALARPPTGEPTSP